jgi:NAD-dependent DNA ligase
VGRSAAKLIVTKLPKFTDLKDIAVTDIKGVGPSTEQSILSWLEDNQSWVEKLPLALEEKVLTSDVITTEIKKVCITGKLDMTRGDLADILTSKGFTVTSTVTKDCYALITGGDTTSSKYKKAVQYNTKIVDYWSSKKDVLQGVF